MIGGLKISPGDFAELRSRRWLVEAVDDDDPQLTTVKLSCIDDDAQGESLEILWSAEIGARIAEDDPWALIGRNGADNAISFSAFLRTVKWRTATAADRDLFQAPFRAGIRLEEYQLLPLQKALRLPRVNLLIADDVGLGKTIEAGLVLRELLLRRRVDFILVAAPPTMTLQWQDELEAKFGLSFQIIDRDALADLRRLRGFGVNPWATGSRFIISHRLLTSETYLAGLRDILGEFRARSILILDEAHHAAPSSGARYAIDSQFTKALRDVAGRFEHRLFLSATPHNGHSNSFSSLLEMLDPQRFTRGVPVRPRDLKPVMIRRLKSDLRALGKDFPKRIVTPILLDGLPPDAPELRLSQALAAYGALRERRVSRLATGEASHHRLIFSGLQQRLLSSAFAFARTLKVHRKSLAALLDKTEKANAALLAAARSFARDEAMTDALDLDLEDAEIEAVVAQDEEDATRAASILGSAGLDEADLRAELASVDAMLRDAEAASARPDARVRWLGDFIRSEMLRGDSWTDRRLIIFTEWEDTRRWLEKRLGEAVGTTDRADQRIGVFSGTTSTDRREMIKQAFNADPKNEPIRILICTDAAREGINLQSRCSDLIHFDLPWNPARLEQRNGRIDRKLQPAREVRCRHFHYVQREEDAVLDALVRKTEVIQDQLGSAGQVIADRIASKLTAGGIARGHAGALAEMIAAETDDDRLAVARAEMDDADDARRQEVKKDLDALRHALEQARRRVGVAPQDLLQVVGVALARAGFPLSDADTAKVGDTRTFQLDPAHRTFADATWQDTLDDLRARRRLRREKVNQWRRDAPVRAIAFEPPVLEDGRDADGVVQVHLEHRLVRRLLGRFMSQGFQSDLNRACVITSPAAQPRVVLVGRIALFGPAAARLHEEILVASALWFETDRGIKPLKPLGARGETTTLHQLEQALAATRAPGDGVVERALGFAQKDVADLMPALQDRAEEAKTRARADLAKRGDDEANSLRALLVAQRDRILKADRTFDDRQLELAGFEAERRQKIADRTHWHRRLGSIERELDTEPARVRASYEVRAERLEPIGLVYLWPATG